MFPCRPPSSPSPHQLALDRAPPRPGRPRTAAAAMKPRGLCSAAFAVALYAACEAVIGFYPTLPTGG
jgi:hypothetical protein